MRHLLLSTAVLAFLVLPAMAQPESRRVGKASVAPEVQDRAQAQLRGQSQQGDNGRGRGRERGNAPASPSQSTVLENRGGRDRGDRNGRDRGDRGAAPAPQATVQSPATLQSRATAAIGRAEAIETITIAIGVRTGAIGTMAATSIATAAPTIGVAVMADRAAISAVSAITIAASMRRAASMSPIIAAPRAGTSVAGRLANSCPPPSGRATIGSWISRTMTCRRRPMARSGSGSATTPC